MAWFRFRGTLPADWDPSRTRAVIDVADERTVWHEGTPWIGVDARHALVPLPGAPDPGAPIELLAQAYARNTEASCHRVEAPRRPFPERYERAALVEIDPDLDALAYDAEFALDLLKTIDEADPAYATILRALNTICNIWAVGSPQRVAAARKTLRNALGSITCEYKHTITAVGHAHLDTAWLWPIRVTKLKMAHTTATQLRLLERYPEYVFVHSQASQYEWLEREYPALFEQVKAAAARGQWEPVGSMWVEADCNLSGGEALIRQFLYGRRYFERHFGVAPRDMWLPDVFGYSAALPQILQKFGIDFFLTQKISWNQFNRFPHHTFWWQGIDGSRVWAHFPPADTYNADCTPKQMVESVKKYRDHARCDQSLYVFGFGDGGGGPTERHLEYLRRARQAPCLPVVESHRRALDFFEEARAKSRDLQTWVGELYLEYHRGTYTSQAANKRDNRRCEFLVRDAEILSCFADIERYPAAEIERLWKLVLLNQFHDILPGSSVREVYEDSSRDYAEVLERGTAIVEHALARLAGHLDTSAMDRPLALFQNACLAGEASLPWPEGEPPQSLVVGDDALPVQLVEGLGERKLVFPAPYQALGAVAVGDLSDAPPTMRPRLKARDRRLENDQFVVRFDAHGNLVSIESLEDRTIEFLQPGRLGNLFQLLDDQPLSWSAWDVDPFAFETAIDLVKSESFEIVERGPVRVAAEIVKQFGSSTLRQRVSLGPTPGIRFDTWIDWHETDKMLKVAFPVNVNATRATYEIQFGSVERPTHVNTSWDAARFEVCAHKWVDVSEGGHGVALLNDGKYGHDVRGSVLRLSLLRSPKAPDPLCDMGEHRFTYVLLPHFDGHAQADVIEAAYALNAPMRHAWVERTKGHAIELPRLVNVGARSVVIEAVKKAEDAPHLIVRLYECHNTRGRTELTTARGVRRAWLCTLDERPIEELPVEDGTAILTYKPFEILTVMLES
jgi:alpha-mannosidase